MNVAAGERAKTKKEETSESGRCFRRRNRRHPLLECARRRKKRLGDDNFHSLEKKLEEFLHPYETLGIDANAITAKYAGEMFLNYCLSSWSSSSSLCCCCCCSQEGGKRTRRGRRRIGLFLRCQLLSGEGEGEEEEEEKQRRDRDTLEQQRREDG